MDRMDVEELLRQHAVDGARLDPAPPETGDRLKDDPEIRTRYLAKYGLTTRTVSDEEWQEMRRRARRRRDQ
ncbi:hypothetical protein ACIO93_31060 [Streptomyces sp. NPDC087903]|uniref:hypothetical protein n=1 Tax=Streptomyces sp. NPDC087903 TaxID=3365819 RepID=UPI003829093C